MACTAPCVPKLPPRQNSQGCPLTMDFICPGELPPSWLREESIGQVSDHQHPWRTVRTPVKLSYGTVCMESMRLSGWTISTDATVAQHPSQRAMGGLNTTVMAVLHVCKLPVFTSFVDVGSVGWRIEGSSEGHRPVRA